MLIFISSIPQIIAHLSVLCNLPDWFILIVDTSKLLLMSSSQHLFIQNLCFLVFSLKK